MLDTRYGLKKKFPTFSNIIICLGIVQLYFTVCSWLWTLVLSYTIYCVIAEGKLWFKLWHVQSFCWILPIILALLPLTTNSYGTKAPDLQWCLIVPRNDTPAGMTLFWTFVSFGFWLFMCILLMVYWSLVIQWRFWGSISSQIIRRAYEKVWLYPVALSLCWLLNVLCLCVPTVSQNPFLVGFGMVLGLSNGMVNSIIFMRNNVEIMHRWMDFLRGKNQPASVLFTPSSVHSFEESSASASAMHSSVASYPLEFCSTVMMYRRSVMLGDGDISEEDLFPSNHSTTILSASARNSATPVTERSSAVSSTVIVNGEKFEMTGNPISFNQKVTALALGQ